jgi:hypothetical protein
MSIIEELKTELEAVLPYSVKVTDKTVQDIGQFVEVYIEQMRDSILELFSGNPEWREKIREHYTFVLADLKNPNNPFFK